MLNNRGIALFVALALLFLLSVTAIVVLLTAYNYTNISENQIKRLQALSAAEAGIHYAYWKIRINEDMDGNPMSDYFPGDCTLNPPVTLPTGWSLEVTVTEGATDVRKTISSKVTY